MASVIRIETPGDLGRALADLRHQTGLTTPQLARRIAENTGQDHDNVRMQLWRWETGRSRNPDLFVMLPALHWHGHDLALIRRENA